jgi:alpha-L-fucosidase 2
VDALLGSGDNYGSYQTLGNLSVSIEGFEDYSNYRRSLDLKTGVHTTKFSSGDADLSVSIFCSYPDEVCVYHISSSSTVPPLMVSFGNMLVDEGLFSLSCDSGYTRVTGQTQQGPPEGMKYDAIALVSGGLGAATECSDDASLRVVAPDDQTAVTILVGAGTNFDQTKGNAEHNYSFKGEDPGPYVEQVTQAAALRSYEELLQSHTEDYGALESTFSLDLPDPNDSAARETADLIANYSADGPGDPFLEALIFDYSRHLLITSSRPNSLPANLQGRWTEELQPAWSSDYHANINLQMNYWVADQTGLGETEVALWNYMEQNWVPRGTETARLLYNASGWVVHNEMNIFGFTAMKEGASWANCRLILLCGRIYH